MQKSVEQVKIARKTHGLPGVVVQLHIERERVDHDVDQFRSSWLSPRVDHRRIRHNDIHQRQKPSRSFAASRYISPRRRRSPPGLLVLSHKVPVHVHEDVPDHDLKITQTIFDLPIPQKT